MKKWKRNLIFVAALIVLPLPLSLAIIVSWLSGEINNGENNETSEDVSGEVYESYNATGETQHNN